MLNSERSWLAYLTGQTVFIISIFFGDCDVQGQSLKQAYAVARNHLVDTAVAGEGITNEAVLAAIRKVPRHEFVPARLRSRAYLDEALAIGSSQTISPPYIVAYMTETLDPQPSDKVLEIGTGSGYQAAVLAEIVGQVYSIEIVSDLARSAERRLKRLGYDNVNVMAGDGYKGWPQHAPFDHIIVTCSPETVPAPLVAQLKEGGTMIIPIGERYEQSFYLFRKEAGRLEHERLVSTLFVPMTGESEDRRRIQPDADNPRVNNGGFEEDGNNDGKPDGWHYQRQMTLMADSPVRGQRYVEFHAKNVGELSQALQGHAINGRSVAAVDISVWLQAERVKRGNRGKGAGLIVHFYDAKRREIDAQAVGFVDGDTTWRQMRRRISVPSKARELLLRIGLNGATGTLRVDEVTLIPREQ